MVCNNWWLVNHPVQADLQSADIEYKDLQSDNELSIGYPVAPTGLNGIFLSAGVPLHFTACLFSCRPYGALPAGVQCRCCGSQL